MSANEETVLDTWDTVDKAIKRLQTALPAQMTAAADALEVARGDMERVLREFALRGLRTEDGGGPKIG